MTVRRVSLTNSVPLLGSFVAPAPAPLPPSAVAPAPPTARGGFAFGPSAPITGLVANPYGINSSYLGSNLAGAIDAGLKAGTLKPAAATTPPAPSGTYAPPTAIIPISAPAAPTISLATAHQAIAQQATSPAAAQFVAGTVGSAALGHPTAIANAEVLNLAQRLQVQAQYVAKYLGQTQAAAIAKGLHLTNPMQVPIGTGKYGDVNLPLYLEQTVDAMIATNKDPSQLAQLRDALYQRAA